MADSKLRMDIITALDSAGIKATERQLDGLEQKLKQINDKSSASKLENALGKLPGKAGQIASALGGLASKAAAIVASFKLGMDAGTWLVDNIQKKLPRGWWNEHLFAVEELVKANKQLKKWQEDEVQIWHTKGQLIQNYYAEERANIEKSIAKLNAQSQAYQRLSKAASEFATAGSDADVQRLERERFEDILQLQAAGEYDAAEQVNKMYDVLKKELETKKEIAAFDAESARMQDEALLKEKQADSLLQKVDKLKKEKWTLEEWKDQLDAGLSNKDIDKNQSQINARLKAIERELTEAEKQANTLADDLGTQGINDAARAMKRATMIDRLNLERDQVAQAYDTDLLARGNLLGVEFTKEYAEKLNQTSMDSYNELKDIKDNTQELATKLDELLSLKQ